MDENTKQKLRSSLLEIMDEFVRICDKSNLEYFLYAGTLLGAVRHKGFIPWDDDIDVAMPRKDYEKFLEIAPKELNNKFEIDNCYTNKLCYLNFTKLRNKNTLMVQNFQENTYDGPKGIWIDIQPLDNLKKEKGILQDIRIKTVKKIRSIAHYKSNIFIGNNKIKLKKIIGKMFKFVPLNKLIRLQDKLMKVEKDENSKYFIAIASRYNYKKQTMPKTVFLPAIELEFEGKKYKAPNNYDFFLKRIYGEDYMEIPKNKKEDHDTVRIEFEKSEN